MARILAIDYGLKRCGIAVTDPLQMIASPLTTLETGSLRTFLEQYVQDQEVACFVLGAPYSLSGQTQPMLIEVKKLKNRLQQIFPSIPVILEDERYTSKMAAQTLIDAGLKKKARKDKGKLDAVSAALILQSYLESK